MRYTTGLLKSIVAILLLVLVGCGGGGGSDSTSGTLTVSVVAPTSTAPTGTATAVYTDALGRNPQGLEISFSTDRPDIVALDSTKQSVGSNGQAVVTFRTITPSVNTPVKLIASTGGLQAFQQITVAGSSTGTAPPPVAASPNSIAFIAASPSIITLKGMGGSGRVEASIVTFEVRDTAGQPLAGQTVDFSLNTSVGGLTITPTFSVSDSSGRVQTIVNSGTIATPIRVTATVRGSSPPISIQSDQLVVSTGIPDQDSLSISIGTFNVEGWDFDGETTTITARLADHFNNPVPDGTAISFTTEGGSIQPSCTTVNGVCSVVWTSQNPRPTNGLVTILAYAVGEESFIDFNGNGLADAGEFTDLAEAFRDDNLDGVRQTTETFIDFDSDLVYDAPDGIYNGVLRSTAITGSKTLHIFKNTGIIMSGSTAHITVSVGGGDVPVNGSITIPATGTNVAISIRDVNNNVMPAGTTVAVTTTNGVASGETSGSVANAYGPNSSSIGIVTLARDNNPGTTGTLTIRVTTPNGVVTTRTVTVND